ncbi:MAG: histidine kinase [Clostridiaceae bacterium]|jgi:two-component system sensor histidine kinase YesM|nr:histidine kinase [Clostridiaceae bacterium]
MSLIRKNSIRRTILFGLFASLIPLNIFCIIYLQVLIGKIYEDVAYSYQVLADDVAHRIDHELNRAGGLLANQYAANPLINQVARTNDANEIYHHTYRLNTTLRSYMQGSEFPGIMFVLAGEEPQYQFSAESTDRLSNGFYYRNFFADFSSRLPLMRQNSWIVIKHDERSFLVRVVGRQGIYLGMVILLDELLTKFAEPSFSQEHIFLIDEEGFPLNNEQGYPLPDSNRSNTINRYDSFKRNGDYLILTSTVSTVNTRLVHIIPEKAVAASIHLPQIILVVLVSATVLVVFLVMRALNRTVFKPLSALENTITKIRQGSFESKVEDRAGTEIQGVYDTFNAMMDEIRTLKIQSYEERLLQQQYHLRYLQLQLEPHFFQNSLKGLYALAENRRYLDIQDMLLRLSEQIHYLAHSSTSLVELREELIHTQNYIAIRQASSAFPIECSLSIDNTLNNCRIPVLTIQTFVENSIKYAPVKDRPLVISILVYHTTGEDCPLLNIQISDNGNGYPQELLEHMNREMPEDFESKHIGIANLKNRLRLIYSDRAFIYLSNASSGGAKAEIVLPLDQAETREPQ